jgi:hypothetical protein
MSEASASAMLVGTPEMLDERPGAVTTTLSRSEIEEALSVDPPADLVLEILRAGDGGTEAEKRTLRVEWDRADLESVLVSPETQAFRFSFAPSEIETALDGPDVEGHGLREKAVVLSIAATAAVAGTSAAYAQPDPGSGSRGGDSAQVAGVHDEQTFAQRGIEAGSIAASHDEATFAQRGIQPGQVAASHDEATFAQRGIEAGYVASSHDEATFAQRGIQPGQVAASHDEATFAERGIQPGHVAASHDEATFVQRGIEPGHVAAVHDETTFTARGIDTGAPPVSSDTGSGFDFPSVDAPTAAGVAGALAGAGLLIAAAAFATRRREPGTV